MYGIKEKKERALGTKLFLKGERCNSPKCAAVRKPYRPGVHGKSRRRRVLSEMGLQLQEKQKIRFSYGLREAQMRRIMEKAFKSRGVTGEMIISILERRLDNVVYRLGFARSRSIGRQLVSHGHFLVNGRKVTTPAYEVKVGDVISIRPQSQNNPLLLELKEELKKYDQPIWLKLDKEKIEGEVASLPKDFEMPFNVSKVVDYYSK